MAAAAADAAAGALALAVACTVGCPVTSSCVTSPENVTGLKSSMIDAIRSILAKSDAGSPSAASELFSACSCACVAATFVGPAAAPVNGFAAGAAAGAAVRVVAAVCAVAAVGAVRAVAGVVATAAAVRTAVVPAAVAVGTCAGVAFEGVPGTVVLAAAGNAIVFEIRGFFAFEFNGEAAAGSNVTGFTMIGFVAAAFGTAVAIAAAGCVAAAGTVFWEAEFACVSRSCAAAENSAGWLTWKSPAASAVFWF